jgi:hypothetical protein
MPNGITSCLYKKTQKTPKDDMELEKKRKSLVLGVQK